MNAYEIGDMVIIDRPAQSDLDKCWLTWHPPMDEYDGARGIVKSVSPSGETYEAWGCGPWLWHESWLVQDLSDRIRSLMYNRSHD